MSIEEIRCERCADCICLVAGEHGEWICDELERRCEEIAHCPEATEE